MADPVQRLMSGVRVAILADSGFEQVELTEPRKALQDVGVETTLISVSPGQIQGFHHDKPGEMFEVDLTFDKADPSAFHAVFLPGGVRNADRIRASHNAQYFVQAMDRENKPLAVICHGPWLLVSAGLVAGRKLTSWPTLEDDIRNAGGHWVDQPVVLDRNWVSSRKPADIPIFMARFKELLASHSAASLAGTAEDLPGSGARGG